MSVKPFRNSVHTLCRVESATMDPLKDLSTPSSSTHMITSKSERNSQYGNVVSPPVVPHGSNGIAYLRSEGISPAPSVSKCSPRAVVICASDDTGSVTGMTGKWTMRREPK